MVFGFLLCSYHMVKLNHISYGYVTLNAYLSIDGFAGVQILYIQYLMQLPLQSTCCFMKYAYIWLQR